MNAYKERTTSAMAHLTRILAGLAVGVGLFTTQIASVRSDQAPPVTVPGIDKPVIVVTGEITGAETWTSANYYVLRGAVFVRQGGTLNIQAGTRIIGEAGSVGTLIVERGGRLNAIGTRAQPVVFTSDQPVGARARGDWGGLIINGRAPINVPGGEASGEGDTGSYGGDQPNDDSGTLRFVRVEFSGVEFSPDNELNGIALQAVGRGSTYDYIQAHGSRDDGIEFFGGTADVKHAVISNAADDSLDWTFGWTGRMQFVAIHQRADDADNGIEADNNEFNNELLPRANPQIYNITMCGDPLRDQGLESVRGILFRRGTAVTFRNFLVTGFKTTGMQIDGASTLTQVTNGLTQVGAGVIWDIPTPAHASAAPFIASGRFPSVRLNEPGGLSPNCSNHENPDFRPTGVATLAGGQLAPIQPPNDGFFEAVTYIGAVSPTGDDWTQGWTSYPQR